MPRYVLLRHECPPEYRDGPHWDFMLEEREGLLTWALLELPGAWRTGTAEAPEDVSEPAVVAKPLPTHRPAYLEYEGPVSGGRGSVSRAARGEFDWVEHKEDRMAIRFTSGELRGSVTLRADGDAWELWTGE